MQSGIYCRRYPCIYLHLGAAALDSGTEVKLCEEGEGEMGGRTTEQSQATHCRQRSRKLDTTLPFIPSLFFTID